MFWSGFKWGPTTVEKEGIFNGTCRQDRRRKVYGPTDQIIIAEFQREQIADQSPQMSCCAEMRHTTHRH